MTDRTQDDAQASDVERAVKRARADLAKASEHRPHVILDHNDLRILLAALPAQPCDKLVEALSAIADGAGRRDVKWAGMTAKDIALQALSDWEKR